jgi:predicted nucleic acid-binding protein
VIVTVDLAVYEVANSVWKHQYLLRDLRDGLRYLSIFHGLLETNRIRAIPPSRG